jgi:muramoyltetrapeptide carboxypeptidase
MLKPRALRSGDRIAVVAPASPFGREEFDQGVAELRRLGFEPVYDDGVFAQCGYVAGPAPARAAAIMAAWQDPSIAALIAARGGYGSVQTLPWLDRDTLRRTPKPFVGYSDLTSILTHLSAGCGIVSFHGPMLAGRLGRGEAGYDGDTFVRALMNPEPLGEVAPSGLEVLKGGEAEGPVYGGTLTQLTASLGTPFAFAPPHGHVLFLEDVRERPYRLDRMLTQLGLAGILDTCAALVFGELLGCDEPGNGPTARATVAELTREFPGPVLFGFPAGHVAGPAFTLPLGVRVRVDAGRRPRIIVTEAAVA